MPSQQVEAWKSAYHTRLNRPQYSRQRADQIAANRQRILKALHDGGDACCSARMRRNSSASRLFHAA